MAIGEFFSGRPSQVKQIPTRSNQQTGVMNQLLSQLSPQVGQAFDFSPIAEGATNRFKQQTLPAIGEQFGAANAKRSSGYNQSIANAMRDLQTNLAGQESQFGLQSQGNLGNLLQMGLQPQFENIYEEGTESPFGTIMSQLLPLLLHAGGAAATGGASIPFSSAMYGGNIGSDALMPLMKLFGGGASGSGSTPMQSASPIGGGNIGIPYSNAPQYGFGGRKGRQWSL